jgi:hypothetical protein
MIFGKWFGKKTEAPAAPPADWTPPFLGAVYDPGPLPAGEVWWTLEHVRLHGRRKSLHELVKIDASWDAFRKQRNADYSLQLGFEYGGYDCATEPTTRYRLKPEHLPKVLTLKNAVPKQLPEWTSVDSVFAVSARLAKIMATFEPERLNFIPFAVRSADGSKSHDYFYWQPYEYSDCVDVELSRYNKHPRGDGTYYWARGSEHYPMILIKEKMSGRAVFRNTHGMFFSDPLKNALGDFLAPDSVLAEARAV